jgi:alginate O-acetyltransferase complex protein AlgI
MIDIATLVILASLGAVALAWLVPRAWAFDAVALWTLAVLAWLSWPTALWLALVTLLTPLVLHAGEQTPRRGLVAGLWAAALLAAFVAAQTAVPVIWIGTAFFTLRALHVTGDWWLGRHAAPTLRAHWRYQLFLPVLFVGPIHRLPHFTRQLERHRRSPADLAAGAERVLTGLFSAAVFGEYLVSKARWLLLPPRESPPSFAVDWMASVLDWVALYFVFAGLTGVALGLSLMAGLKLEENFDHPWRARNLVDFWTRWHISLTTWCRDYVFTPVMAVTRSPVAGLVAAMLVVGLWHEISVYYVMWSAWQAGGVLLNRLAGRHLPLDRVPALVRRICAPVLILGWLSLARPVIVRLMELAA